MSTFTAASTIQFLELIEDNGSPAMFRGQANISWPLLPSIARFAERIIGYDAIAHLEAHLLERFKQFGVPFRDFRDLPVIEQLLHAQHYGLPTRLLDWSTNPLKALFFAVEDPSFDKVDGAVFSTWPDFWSEGTKHVLEENEFVAFFPELVHERISAQDACFIAFPLSEESMSVPELTFSTLPRGLPVLQKIQIPAASKMDLRRQLSTLGITHRSVYPGLEGTTRWIKSELSNFRL